MFKQRKVALSWNIFDKYLCTFNILINHNSNVIDYEGVTLANLINGVASLRSFGFNGVNLLYWKYIIIGNIFTFGQTFILVIADVAWKNRKIW